MFYVIKKTGVTIGKSVAEINRKLKAELVEEDFKPLGNDFAIHVDEIDLTFLRDVRRMAQIPMQKLYKKDNLSLLLLVNIILTFIVLVKG